MRYTYAIALMIALLPALPAHAQRDTVRLTDKYTTHFIFSSDISYADLSNTSLISARIVEESRNKLALKAVAPFATTASVSVEESNGEFHTYILAYDPEPESFVIDVRPGRGPVPVTDIDTVQVSDLYTTHFLFSTDISYADVSRPSLITGRLVEQGRNKLALKAKAPFESAANLTVEEGNGLFHSFILAYDRDPGELVVDMRRGASGGQTQAASSTLSANALRKGNAPQLSEIIKRPQGLYHLMARKYKLELLCENIFSYSDITYVVLSLKNGSGISYEAEDALFVIESGASAKKKLVYESHITPKSKLGGLTAAPKNRGRVAYSFDKITLSEDQVLKIYLYEVNGSRNLVMTIRAKDINDAVPPVR